jgi:hypothetical protein
MSLNVLPKREGPKKEISHTQEPHNRPWGATHTVEPRVVRPREDALREMVERARDRLRKLTPATAVEEMGLLPHGMLELYLLVEETEQARPMVLRSFPKPGPRARERYSPFLTVAKRGRRGTGTRKENST